MSPWKEKLITSKAIYEDCKRTNKNLSTVWIDYQKAFNSVPHSWVGKSTEMIRVNSKTVKFCTLSVQE
jgi:hypothetical protein